VANGHSRLFVQMLGAGFDAQVVHHLPLALKRALGRGSYVVQSLRELSRYRYPPIALCVDGVEMHTASVVVTKGHLYAGTYTLAPGANPTMKGFTVALVNADGPFATMAYGMALPLNLMPRMRGVRLLRADHVEISSPDIPAQADGDAAGAGPIVVRDAPSPINVVVG
jgi:diacylglycerol kinase family enzyme